MFSSHNFIFLFISYCLPSWWPSAKMECDYLYGWIIKMATYAKIPSEMVNPRNTAGECRRRRRPWWPGGKASAPGVEDLGINPSVPGQVMLVSLKFCTLVAALTDSWHYRFSTRTDWLGGSVASVDQVWSWEYILVVLSVAVLLVAVETDVGETVSAAKVAFVCGLWSVGVVALLSAGPCSYFCIHQLLFSCLEVLVQSVQSASPCHAVSCKVLPGLGVYVKCFHDSLADILVVQLWAAFGSPSRCQLSIENVFWVADILHAVLGLAGLVSVYNNIERLQVWSATFHFSVAAHNIACSYQSQTGGILLGWWAT